MRCASLVSGLLAARAAAQLATFKQCDVRVEALERGGGCLAVDAAAVNATLPPHEQLSLRDGEGAGEIVTGEAQVLRFEGARSGHGDRMHVHVDKKGTRWVAIMSMGETSTFIL